MYWMKKLSDHFENLKTRYPNQKFIVVFDIDGTILDMRNQILFLLFSYDRENQTKHFENLKIKDIKVHENEVEALLNEMNIAQPDRKKILDWYLKKRWSKEALLEAHRPFSGVLEVMRWFQVQKNCYVGLNSGRPEKIRKETLESINQLGKELRLKFTDEFLFLNQLSWEQGVAESKVAGLNYFKNKNFLPIAFIDNEPSILDEIANSYKSRDLLLLHADTIYQHKRKHGPKAKITRGKVYDLKSIIYEWMLPKEIDLVWHGVNDDLNMRQFLASPVTWCECDIRLDAITQLPYLRHDSFQETSLDKDDEKPPLLKDYLEKIKKHEKKIKLDFKQGEPLLTKCIDLFKEYNFSDDELWFNGNPKDIRESGFKKIAKNYPNSINQCPIDGLVFLMGLFDDDIGKILDKLCSWGINRFSLSWETKGLYKILDFLENRNNEVNVYGVPSLDAFLRAILLQPTSLTSDFNFPQWNYFGRGSGKGLKHHNFEIKKKI